MSKAGKTPGGERGEKLPVYDVPATELIETVAADLKKDVKQPEWVDFVKSSRHRERAPHRRDWFYVRMASILYRIYKQGNIGTNRLRTYYGGRKNRGVRPHRFFKSSGKLIRVCLQLLEKQGLVKKEKKGRTISSKGESYLNSKAKEVRKALDEKLAKEKEAAAAERKERKAKEAKEKGKGQQKVEVPKGEKPGPKKEAKQERQGSEQK